MQVILNVPDELAARAKAQGVSVEAYVQSLIEQAAAGPRQSPQRKRTPEEFRAWLEEFTQYSDKIPVLPAEAISREVIYEDRD